MSDQANGSKEEETDHAANDASPLTDASVVEEEEVEFAANDEDVEQTMAELLPVMTHEAGATAETQDSEAAAAKPDDEESQTIQPAGGSDDVSLARSAETAAEEGEGSSTDQANKAITGDDDEEEAVMVENDVIAAEALVAAESSGPSGSWLGSWWSGGNTTSNAETVNEAETGTISAEDGEEKDLIVAANDDAAASPARRTKPPKREAPPTQTSPGTATEATQAVTDAATALTIDTENEEASQEPRPPKPQLNEADQSALDEAFEHQQQQQQNDSDNTTENDNDDDDMPRTRGLGRIPKQTLIPNADVALRLLRKFACKTRHKITTTYGGGKPRSIVSYIMMIKKSNQREDATFVAYRDLMQVLWDDVDKDPEEYYYNHFLQQQPDGIDGNISYQYQDHHHQDDYEEQYIVGSVLGDYPGDDMTRARKAIAAFVHLAGLWGHASSWYLEPSGGSNHPHAHSGPPSTSMMNQTTFSDLLAACWDASTTLVAHGCLDNVDIQIFNAGGADSKPEEMAAVNMLALSIFNSDLTMERNELAALKFLLTTGCRNMGNGQALLRGSHLLQTIRTLYHIYLTTESQSNKTTAKASLQQLVSSVFARVIQTDLEEQLERTADGFPSENHRDAFLVLRAICKLSMRNLPDPSSGMHSHIGIASSGSNATWNGMDGDSSQRGLDALSDAHPSMPPMTQEHAELIYTAAIHPALESKLLALDLIFYVLDNTSFSRGFITRAGSQFHAAVRNYLCVSLLKNCTSGDTQVVNVSLRLFVPLVRSFRTILKNEIEAFVTNVFFVILDSKNSPAEHKSIVVNTFEEICSDPSTLAEIFLNYDCDLSAVDLFHRIVNTLSKIARTGLQQEQRNSGIGFMGGASAARQERERSESRELRLDAMKALRQVLASLHASSVEPMARRDSFHGAENDIEGDVASAMSRDTDGGMPASPSRESAVDSSGQKLVDIYDSKRKRREEASEVILRFNQKPSAGISYAIKCGHVDGDDAADVAQFLLKNKDNFEKAMIGEYLGREPEYQGGFSLKVLHEYVRLIDFEGLGFDDGIRLFLSGFRLPGEAQKIDRIMEKFAERYTEQNPLVFPSADTAFILAFSVIMLNTDLHNPAIKEDRRMTKDGFVRNNRGICDGQDLPEELLHSIFDRIKENPISLKEDDEARQRVGKPSGGIASSLGPASFFASHYEEMDRARESNFQKERDHIVRTTEALLKRRRHGQDHSSSKLQSKSRPEKQPRPISRFVRTEDSGLRDEYVSPMFDVAWGAALAAFSTAMESANGTVGALIAIASDEELEFAAENAAETIEVCLTGFRFAICTAGLCGNHVARDAFVLALSRFSQLGTGALLEPRHVRCIQTMMSLAREDGELLGPSWEHFFRALSEINRFHQLFNIMARNDRAAAAAAARRQKKRDERERRRRDREARRAAEEEGDSVTDAGASEGFEDESETDDSLAESGLFDEADDFPFEEDMDARAIDESNARVVYDAVSETVIEAIYERSSSLSEQAIKDFTKQLCFVSRSEISVGGANLLYNNKGGDQFHHNQVNIYCLQKLVEVAHYNMESRSRLVFSDLWTIVADHLTFAALHFNPAIAMYAVDSFRQLSIQYLKRDELEVFEFQKRFLKPLDVIMARSEQVSTKELLLNCVDRIILVFKTDASTSSSGNLAQRKGGLRSGWMPILSILGLGGLDSNRDIAKQSFKILMDEIKLCLKETEHPGVLLSEHFVETVTAIFMFIAGPHEDIGRRALEHLTKLTEYLVKEDVSMPQVRRRASIIPVGSGHGPGNNMNEDLELWWPILLGLSRAVGDLRPELRSRALETLIQVITSYFFPSDPDVNTTKRRTAHDDIQTLQIVFRGILFPILENAELGSDEGDVPVLPEDFERFLTKLDDQKTEGTGAVEDVTSTGWLETMFDSFMDACISLCLRSILVFKKDLLVEEVLALLTNCLMSDSGALAVRGLQRLEQFITSDLNSSNLDDEKWGAISHMLRRCLFVRNLPPIRASAKAADAQSEDEATVKANQEEYEESVQEFVSDDIHFADRRYIPSNATMVIGMLLSSDRFSIGLRWRLFLVAGLGRGIVEWERAAMILEQDAKAKVTSDIVPPSYFETAMYGRRWMNRFILQLVSTKEIAQAPTDADPKSNRFAAGQKLVADETQRLLAYFLKSETTVAQYQHDARDDARHVRFTTLVNELLSGYNKMDGEHLKDIAWINPILLGTCIQSKNEDIRLAVQKLVQRTAPKPTPYPAPTTPESRGQKSPAATPDATQEPVIEQEIDEGVEHVVEHADSLTIVEDADTSLEVFDAVQADGNAEHLNESTLEQQDTSVAKDEDQVVFTADTVSSNGDEQELELTIENVQPPRPSSPVATILSQLPEDYFERAELMDFAPLDQVAEAFRKPSTYVLDIRNDDEIEMHGHVDHPNWKQCPGTPADNELLSTNPEAFVPDRNATIIVYCRSGRRSNRAKKVLLEQGYTGLILNAGGHDDIKTIV
ncbi:hypothetical protein MPSEU_000009100 [Mayamaea pseudoterrestris]|nr:hypothetical protein MPSEU_000009100 [Mayamaea pseudoterrestris]